MQFEHLLAIYFEVLEQSFLFSNILQEIYGENVSIERIKSSKSLTRVMTLAEDMVPSFLLKNYDLVLTLCTEEKEYPICTVEFSNSIPTRDHMIQRADGLILSSLNDIPHVKIMSLSYSSSKAFQEGAGLLTGFDIDESYKAAWQSFKLPSLVLHSELTNANHEGENFALRDSKFKSIPIIEIGLLQEFIEEATKGIKDGFTSAEKIRHEMKTSDLAVYSKFRKNTLKLDNFTPPPTKHKRLEVQNSDLRVRIYRYGHAMDPGRGELYFYRLVWGKPLIAVIDPNDATQPLNSDNALKDFERYILGRNVTKNDYKGSKLYFDSSNTPETLNSPGRAIFNNCKKIIILNRGTDHPREELLEIDINPKINYGMNFEKVKISHETYVNQTKKTTEDIVSFSTIHGLLNSNNQKIHSVSFPGDQGELAFIPIAEGRRSSRTYIDMVSILMKESKNYLFLTEAKGHSVNSSVSNTNIQRDIEKIIDFKRNHENYIYQRINNTKFLSPEIFLDKDLIFEDLFVGVAFPKYRYSGSEISVDLASYQDLDYLVKIDFNKWEIIINNKKLEKLIIQKNGVIEIPNIYEIKTT